MDILRTFALLFFFGLTCVCCRNSNENKEMDAYFEKEIANRKELLEKLPHDSLKINASEIDDEINKIILLSKDIENLSASVNRANHFFREKSVTYELNDQDFTYINTGMHVDEIASVLKQNELNLLNQLIFKLNPDEARPYTAQ